MKRVRKARTRTATLWLKNDTFLEVPECMWPTYTHGDDHTAATRWHEITGLTVAVETTNKATVGTQ